jgi:hypothetical protein
VGPPWQSEALPLDRLVPSKKTNLPDDTKIDSTDSAKSLPGDPSPDINERLLTARAAAAIEASDTLAMFGLEAAGREATRKRMAHWCNSGRLDEISLSEFCAAVRQDTPLLSQMLDPRHMTLRQWSQVAISAMVDATVPRWPAVIALQRLGVDSLSLAQQQRLLGHLESLGNPADPLTAATARRDGAWQPGGNALGTVILLRKTNSTSSERWTRPPTRGLVLLATVEDVERLLAMDPALFNVLPRPVAVYIEGKREDAAIPRGLVRRIREAVRGGNLLVRLRRRWNTKSPDEDFAVPVEPGNPDDLFDTSSSA